MKLIKGLDAARGFVASMESARLSSAGDARKVAQAIIDQVRAEGDVAVAGVLQRFDGISIEPRAIASKICPREEEKVAPELVDAIEMAIERIGRFHAQQRQAGYSYREGSSAFEHRVRPLRRVGIYVPGGRAVYLSTLMMCAVPARLAGVESLVIATTPRAAERAELKYLCTRLGITEIYRCGGAAGIAALALGTETLERVDKIVGPGNSYVTQAKNLLLGEVGIDMTAGPTEVVIIADETSDATIVAGDLLAQAEHGEDSATILVTASERVAENVTAEVQRLLAGGSFETAAISTKNHGAVLLVESIDEAVDLTNRIGPEHVEVQTENADAVGARIDNCGAVFVGKFTPVAAGDYIAGPNHVLPTGGAARFFSPLGAYDFYKRSNLVRLEERELRGVGEAASLLARLEGLPLHAESIDRRLV